MTYYLLGCASGIAFMFLKDVPWAKVRDTVAAKLKKTEPGKNE